METPPKPTGEPPSKGNEWGCYLWVILLLFIFFPIPPHPWRLAVISLMIFGVRAAFLVDAGKDTA